IRALGTIGHDARSAIPNLRAVFFEVHAKLQAEAAEALGKIGRDAIPVFTEALKSSDPTTRRLAVQGLGKVGAPAVPDPVDALGDKQVDVRRLAVQVLQPMRITDKMVVLGFAFALKDADDEVRTGAVYGLQQLGAAARQAAPALKNALVDMNPNVRQQA